LPFERQSAIPGAKNTSHFSEKFHPAMNLEDLKKATPGIEKAVNLKLFLPTPVCQ
jgi:hypothetical protein